MRSSLKFTCGAVIVAVLSSTPGYAAVSNADTEKLLKALEKQAKRIEAEERTIAQHQKRVASERAEFEALKSKVMALTGVKMKASPAQTAAAGQQRQLVPAVQQDGSGGAPAEVGTDRKQEAPEKPPEVARYIEEGGVLLPKGRIEVAPSLEFNHLSATTVAIEGFSIVPALNIGLFDISQVNRDVLIGAIQTRLGVTNRIEVEAKVPYVYGQQSTTGRQVGVGASSNTVTNIDGNGLGDIEVGAHYQINQGKNGWPYFVANLRYKTTTGNGPYEDPPSAFGLPRQLATGSGFAAIQPSITTIMPSDPVVFYSNLGYVHSFSASFPSYGEIQPGGAINSSFGMSLGLNDSASVSLGYSHSMVFRSMVNDNYIPGSYTLQIGSLDVGFSYALTDWMAVNTSISAGLTSDAPDDRVIVRVPMSYDLF